MCGIRRPVLSAENRDPRGDTPMADYPKSDPPKPETAPNGPKNGALLPKQEAAALALASGRTIEQAAAASNSGGGL